MERPRTNQKWRGAAKVSALLARLYKGAEVYPAGDIDRGVERAGGWGRRKRGRGQPGLMRPELGTPLQTAGRQAGRQTSVRKRGAERTSQPRLLLFRRADSRFARCAAAPSDRRLWGTCPRGASLGLNRAPELTRPGKKKLSSVESARAPVSLALPAFSDLHPSALQARLHCLSRAPGGKG